METFMAGTSTIVVYILIAAGLMLTMRKCCRIPDELFRKILHFILLGAYVPLVFAFETWWMAAVFASALLVILFPILSLAEKLPMFSAFVNERKKGEFKSSMVLAIGMMAFSVSLCWGLLGDRWLVLASIYAWGVGDAFAALVGKRFGKHKIKWKWADGKKSAEGSLAMFVCSLGSVFTILLMRGGVGWPLCIGIAVLTAAACTVAEMCAKNGLDTVVCPLTALAVLLPAILLLGGA